MCFTHINVCLITALNSFIYYFTCLCIHLPYCEIQPCDIGTCAYKYCHMAQPYFAFN